ADLGATYHVGSVTDLAEPDIVIECTGAPQLVLDVIEHIAPAGIVCLAGVSSGGRTLSVDIGATNRQMVLENAVILGSVNANRSHYEAATAALGGADPQWLAGVVTRRVPLDAWVDGLHRQPDDVKVVIDLRPDRAGPID
ncbi:MAG: theronine dehydrogenase, partial [Ilumatobacteraceae bacterium]